MRLKSVSRYFSHLHGNLGRIEWFSAFMPQWSPRPNHLMVQIIVNEVSDMPQCIFAIVSTLKISVNNSFISWLLICYILQAINSTPDADHSFVGISFPPFLLHLLFTAILLYPFYIIQQPIQLQNQNSTTHQLTSLKTQHRQPDQPFRISTRPIKPPTYLQNSVQIMP